MSASSAFHDTFGQYDPSEQVRSFECHAPVAPAAAPAARQAPLRLTRRGRFVFFGVPLILLAALLLSFSGFFNAPAKAAESTSELSLTPTVSVTVQAGDSLWAIAGAIAPDRDPRDVVADIVQLNNLAAARVEPGQQLFVPTN
jgi:nucleoid-associated protein YgaU